MDYFRTWSATARYQQATGQNPLEILWDDSGAPGAMPPRWVVRWPVMMRAGRVKEQML